VEGGDYLAAIVEHAHCNLPLHFSNLLFTSRNVSQVPLLYIVNPRYGHLQRIHCLLLIFDVRAQTGVIKGAANCIAITHLAVRKPPWMLTYWRHYAPKINAIERFQNAFLLKSKILRFQLNV